QNARIGGFPEEVAERLSQSPENTAASEADAAPLFVPPPRAIRQRKNEDAPPAPFPARTDDFRPAAADNSRMSKETHLRQVLDCGIVAVVRSPDGRQLVEVARALADGGVTVVEITMSVPNALDVLRQVRQALGDRLLL